MNHGLRIQNQNHHNRHAKKPVDNHIGETQRKKAPKGYGIRAHVTSCAIWSG